MKNRIRQIRNHFALTQTAFAHRINKTVGFISNVETGKSGLSVETIQCICSLFGINEEWLRSGTGEMFCDGKEREEVNKNGIGERVKKVRMREKLTQEQFGNSIGFHKNQIYCVENGKIMPSDAFIEKVCKQYAVRIDWVLYGKGEMDSVSDGVDEQLIAWLKDQPAVVRELRIRAGLEENP